MDYKAKIICLKDNAHSVQMASECVAQGYRNGVAIQYFNAVNGNDFNIACAKYGIQSISKVKKGRLGVLGCFLSHYGLWKECVEENIPYLILEHDGYFIRPLPKDILTKFKHVCKLEPFDPYSGSYNHAVEQSMKEDIVVGPYHNIHAKGKRTLNYVGNYFRGAWSYIIKPEAAQKLLDFVAEHGYVVAADQQIGSKLLELSSTNVPVARLHPFYSIGININSESLTQHLGAKSEQEK